MSSLAHAVGIWARFCSVYSGTTPKVGPIVYRDPVLSSEFGDRAGLPVANGLIERTREKDDLTVEVLGWRRKIQFFDETAENKERYNVDDHGKEQQRPSYFYTMKLEIAPSENSKDKIGDILNTLVAREQFAFSTAWEAVKTKYDAGSGMLEVTFEHTLPHIGGNYQSRVRGTQGDVLQYVLSHWDLRVGDKVYVENGFWVTDGEGMISKPFQLKEFSKDGNGAVYEYEAVVRHFTEADPRDDVRVSVIIPEVPSTLKNLFGVDRNPAVERVLYEIFQRKAPHGSVGKEAGKDWSELEDYIAFYRRRGVTLTLPDDKNPNLLVVQYSKSAQANIKRKYETRYESFVDSIEGFIRAVSRAP